MEQMMTNPSGTPGGAGILLSDDSSNREEWLAFRRQGIGGSDAPVLMGLDPVQGPLSLYVDKMGMELDQDDVPHEAAYWGRVLEAVVADEFSRRSGLRVEKPTRVFRHTKYPWMLGTCDRLVYDPKRPRFEGVFEVPHGILEVKTTSVRREHLWEEGVPPMPYCQLQHYLAVTGLENGYVAVLIGGQQFRYYEVPRDEEYISRLIEKEQEFWDYVQRREPPPVDGTDASTAIVNKRYLVSMQESSVEVSQEVASYVSELQAVKRAGKAGEREQKRLENLIKVAMGTAEYAMYRGQVLVTWKSSEQRRLDTDRLKRDLPEIANEYTRSIPVRTFRVAASRASGEVPEDVDPVEGDTARLDTGVGDAD